MKAYTESERQALIADCKEDMRRYTSDSPRYQLAEIVLACLEAEPVAEISHDSGIPFVLWQTQIDDLDPGFLYTVQPVPVMKPVKLPSRFSPAISPVIKGDTTLPSMRLNPEGGWLSRNLVIAAIKEAGGDVEGEDNAATE